MAKTSQRVRQHVEALVALDPSDAEQHDLIRRHAVTTTDRDAGVLARG